MNYTVRGIVDEVIKDLEFTAPVELEDIHVVHARLAAKMPRGARLEVYHRIRDVVVEVRETFDELEHITCRRVLEVK